MARERQQKVHTSTALLSGLWLRGDALPGLFGPRNSIIPTCPRAILQDVEKHKINKQAGHAGLSHYRELGEAAGSPGLARETRWSAVTSQPPT